MLSGLSSRSSLSCTSHAATEDSFITRSDMIRSQFISWFFLSLQILNRSSIRCDDRTAVEEHSASITTTIPGDAFAPDDYFHNFDSITRPQNRDAQINCAAEYCSFSSGTRISAEYFRMATSGQLVPPKFYRKFDYVVETTDSDNSDLTGSV